MRSLIGGLLGAVLIGLPASAAHTSDENALDRKAEFKTIQRDFDKARADGDTGAPLKTLAGHTGWVHGAAPAPRLDGAGGGPFVGWR